MARYFMQLRGGSDEVLDRDGMECASLAALREMVLFTARDLIATDVRLGLVDFRLRIDAEDERGDIVHTLHLKQAVNIVNVGQSLSSCVAEKPRAFVAARSDAA